MFSCMCSTTFLLGFLTLLGAVYVYSVWTFDYWKKRGIKSTRSVPFFGSLWDIFTFKKSIGCVLQDAYNKYPKEDYVGMWVFTKPAIILRSPELIKAVLVKDFQNFRDRTIYSDSQADPLGSNNLFSIKNPQWRYLRVKISPVFTSGKMKNLFNLVENVGNDMVNHVDNCLERKEDEFNARDLCSKYTTDSISSVAFGVEANSFKDPNALFQRLGKLMFKFNFLRSIEFSALFFAPAVAKFCKFKFFSRACSTTFRKVFWQVMNDREANPVQRHDLINLLLDLKNEVSEGKSELKFEGDTLVSQATVFFTGGFETSSSTMSFTLFELAHNPHLQDKLYESIMEEMIDGKITYESLQNMTYLDMCVKETLRKYPTLPFLDRLCQSKYTLPGTNIELEPGTFVYIPLIGLQMDPQYFPNPEVFDPERFSPVNIKNIKPFTYMPFGEGPRNCIGERFGLLQSKFGLARLLSKYKVSTCQRTPKKIVMDPKALLSTPLNDLELKITSR